MVERPTSSPLARLIALAGGLVFVGSLAYFAWTYVWRFDRPAPAGAVATTAAVFDVILFSIFALHHTLFARTRLKHWVQRAAPPQLERSIYVWIASLLLIAVCWWWQPVPGVLWQVEGAGAWLLYALQLVGGVGTLVAARRLDVLELAGIRQVLLQSTVTHPLHLHDRDVYGLVRHPIYTAWVVLVWCAPLMNGTRLVFAAISSAYLFLAVPFEERDLVRAFGPRYSDYQRRVRWRIIPFVY
jgi:methanethiol S-methyltransferase